MRLVISHSNGRQNVKNMPHWDPPYSLLTPWSTALLEKLTGSHLVKFSAFYGTRRFITAFTSARHSSLFCASSIQSMPPHPTSWRTISEIRYIILIQIWLNLLTNSFSIRSFRLTVLELQISNEMVDYYLEYIRNVYKDLVNNGNGRFDRQY